MKKTIHHSIVLAILVLAVTGCQNQNSGMIPRGQTISGNTAIVPEGTVTQATRPERGAYFQYQAATYQELQYCMQACPQGNCSARCNQIFYDMIHRGVSPTFLQNRPQINLFGSLFGTTQGNGYVFDTNQFEMSQPQWVNGYKNHLGPNYYTLNDMNAYCNNPSAYIDESVTIPTDHCNNLDMNYVLASQYSNDAFNYYINGKPQLAQAQVQQLQNYQGICKGCYVLKYGTPWGKRNVAAENQVIKADFKRTWENLKHLPANAGMRLANGLLNVVMTRAMIPVAQIDARLAMMNYNGMQTLNYYENMASLAYNAAAIPVYMTGGTCDSYYPSQGVGQVGSQGTMQSGFVICQVDNQPDQYIISCNANHIK